MVAAIGAVAGVAGAAISAGATKDAASGQQAATEQSNALQQYMYDNNVKLQMPTITTGNAARDRLSYLLGLSPNGFSGTVNGAPKQTYDTLRASLLGQYTRQQSPSGGAIDPQTNGQYQALIASGYDPAQATQIVQSGNSLGRPGGLANLYTSPDEQYRAGGAGSENSSYVDENALDAAIKQRLAEQDAAIRAQEEAAKNDPNYGRLSQQYVPDKFSYTGEDLYDDPSYQFRLQQGQKALDRQGAAAGRFLSGSQLQAASDYNQGAASQEFQSAYNRALGTFSTNENNRFGAYQANFNNAVNPLLSLAGAATLGSQNLGAAGASTANAISSNLTNNANAQGAAGIAGANTISNGLTGAVSGYQQNQLLSTLTNNRGVNNNPYAWNGGSLPNPSAYDLTRD